jgi:MFS transporter, DHA1 family, inner membrane transport protein
MLKKPKTWWSISIVTLFITGMATSYSYMAEYLKETVHLDGKTVSLALLLFGAAGVFGNIVLGRLLTKSIAATVWGFFAGLIIVQGLLFLSGAAFFASLALTTIWGFIHTGGFLLGQTLITNSAPEAPEFSSSIFVSAGNLGFSLGSLLGGLALETVGIDKLPLVSIAVLLVASLAYFLRTSSSIGRHKQPMNNTF